MQSLFKKTILLNKKWLIYIILITIVGSACGAFISTALRVSISHTSPIKGNHDGIVEDHAKVYNAIKNRNPERAKQSMLALIDEALNFIEDEIVKQESAK